MGHWIWENENLTVHLKTVDDPKDNPDRFQSRFESGVINVDTYKHRQVNLKRAIRFHWIDHFKEIGKMIFQYY